MVKEDRATWKSNYFLKLLNLLEDYPKCFIVGVDNVRSKQMQQIRGSLRGAAELLMGKNTLIRKAIRGNLEGNPHLEKLLPHIVGNVGFVFTQGDLIDVREKIQANKVAAPAKAGAIAPIDVSVPPQNTGLGPEKTSFFQALQIPTKISRGTIEILSSVQLIHAGEKVDASAATLLNMLKIYPFSYGLVIKQVYDNGAVFEPAILDISDDDIRTRFISIVQNIASVSLAIGYPTPVSAPHSILNGFKNLMAIAVETEIDFEAAAQVKEYLADPSKFAALAAPAAETKTEAAPAAEEAKKDESESESDDDMGFGLFD